MCDHADVKIGCGGGDECSRISSDVGISGCWSFTNAVAPNFANFSGKLWESEFPRVLGEYYRTFNRFGCCGSCSVHGCGGSGGNSYGCRSERCTLDCARGDTKFLELCGSSELEDECVGAGSSLLRDVRSESGSHVDCRSDADDNAKVELKLRGPVTLPRGNNYERNQRNRAVKKKRKKLIRETNCNKKDCVSDVAGETVVGCDRVDIIKSVDWRADESVPKKLDVAASLDELLKRDIAEDPLRKSLRKKWQVENELAIIRAERQIQVLKANSVDAEASKYRTQVRVATEKNMVAIEKSHALLKSTDNVPRSDVDHDVHTVVDSTPGLSLNSGSISPDSSASQAEFRKAQKDLLDSEAEVARLRAALVKVGLSVEAVEAKDKSLWTDTSENHRLLDQLYPDGYPMITAYCEDGKFQIF